MAGNGAVKLQLDKDVRAMFKARGVMVMECVLDQSHYSLTMVSRICDINPQWLRQLLKKGKVKASKNSKNHWVIDRTEVKRVWEAEVAKHVARATAQPGDKEYTYRRPTEWAAHLITKFVNTDPSVTPQEKKVVLGVIDRAVVVWDAAYQHRQEVKAANKAKANK